MITPEQAYSNLQASAEQMQDKLHAAIYYKNLNRKKLKSQYLKEIPYTHNDIYSYIRHPEIYRDGIQYMKSLTVDDVRRIQQRYLDLSLTPAEAVNHNSRMVWQAIYKATLCDRFRAKKTCLRVLNGLQRKKQKMGIG